MTKSNESKYNVVVRKKHNGNVALYTDKPITFKEMGYFLSTLLYTTIDTPEFFTSVYELTPGGTETLCTGTVQENMDWQFNEEVKRSKNTDTGKFILTVSDSRLSVDVYKMADDIQEVYDSLKFFKKNILHPNYKFKLEHNGTSVGEGSLDECKRQCELFLGINGEPVILFPNEVDWKDLYINTELDRIDDLVKQGDTKLGMKLVRDLVQRLKK